MLSSRATQPAVGASHRAPQNENGAATAGDTRARVVVNFDDEIVGACLYAPADRLERAALP
jgi:hypothetical protein